MKNYIIILFNRFFLSFSGGCILRGGPDILSAFIGQPEIMISLEVYEG